MAPVSSESCDEVRLARVSFLKLIGVSGSTDVSIRSDGNLRTVATPDSTVRSGRISSERLGDL